MITATNKQASKSGLKFPTFTRSLKLARGETFGSPRCSSYHNYYEPKVLEYFNSVLNKLVLNLLKLQFIVNIKSLASFMSFIGKG